MRGNGTYLPDFSAAQWGTAVSGPEVGGLSSISSRWILRKCLIYSPIAGIKHHHQGSLWKNWFGLMVQRERSPHGGGGSHVAGKGASCLQQQEAESAISGGILSLTGPDFLNLARQCHHVFRCHRQLRITCSDVTDRKGGLSRLTVSGYR